MEPYASFILPQAHRVDYSQAWGPVVSGDIADVLKGRVACIGDYVSRHCVKAWEELEALVLVVDGVTRRHEKMTGLEVPSGFEVHEARNRKGTLAFEAHSLLCRILARGSGRHIVLIRGEEDLVALSAIACGQGWTVVYGVPGAGAVVLEVTPLTASIANTRILSLSPSLSLE